MKSIVFGLLGLALAAAASPGAADSSTRPAAEIRQAIAQGDPQSRAKAVLSLIHDPEGLLKVDDSMLDGLVRATRDRSPDVRGAAAILIGSKWIQMRPQPLPLAVSTEIAVAEHDPDLEARHDAVAAGLKPIKDKSDAVVRALVDAAMTAPRYDDRLDAQVIFGLENVAPSRLVPLLEPYWADAAADPERAVRAYMIYAGATHQEPPNAQRLDRLGDFALPVFDSGGLSRDQLVAEIHRRLPADVEGELILNRFRGQWIAEIVIHGIGPRRRAVAALAKSPYLTVASDFDRWEQVKSSQALEADRQASAQQAKEDAQRQQSLAGTYSGAFQKLYDYLGSNYPEFQMKGIDWPAVGRQLLPRAAQVSSEREFGLLVEALVAQLKDSHAVVEAAAADPPDPPLPNWYSGFASLRDDRNRPAVYFVQPGSPAERAGVRPGMIVISIDGIPAAKLVSQWERQATQYVGYSSPQALDYDAVRAFTARMQPDAREQALFEKPGGDKLEADLVTDQQMGYLPRLPVPIPNIADAADVSSTRLPGGIGYIYVRRIRNDLEPSLDRALAQLSPMRGLVIDVRGNSGGGFDPGIAFVNFDLSPLTTTQPDRPRYRGPIAMLIDGRCISAGEGWASWFVANQRARFFGSETAGASSYKQSYPLSNGLYSVIVPLRPYDGFLNRPIEVRGLEPDVPIRCTAADLANGRDTVLDTAVDWLKSVPSKKGKNKSILEKPRASLIEVPAAGYLFPASQPRGRAQKKWQKTFTSTTQYRGRWFFSDRATAWRAR